MNCLRQTVSEVEKISSVFTNMPQAQGEKGGVIPQKGLFVIKPTTSNQYTPKEQRQ